MSLEIAESFFHFKPSPLSSYPTFPTPTTYFCIWYASYFLEIEASEPDPPIPATAPPPSAPPIPQWMLPTMRSGLCAGSLFLLLSLRSLTLHHMAPLPWTPNLASILTPSLCTETCSSLKIKQKHLSQPTAPSCYFSVFSPSKWNFSTRLRILLFLFISNPHFSTSSLWLKWLMTTMLLKRRTHSSPPLASSGPFPPETLFSGLQGPEALPVFLQPLCLLFIFFPSPSFSTAIKCLCFIYLFYFI